MMVIISLHLLLLATVVATNKIAKLSQIYECKSRVLVVGDGDFSFSRFLAEHYKHQSIIATTMDTPEVLYSSFQKAKENVDAITRYDRSYVNYCIDATMLDFHFKSQLFDVIMWNFPHIVGKQNIKRNRELIYLFLLSASKILSPNGSIKVSLCEKQCGTQSRNRFDWDHSWKLSAQVADAGLLLSHRVNFNPIEYVGYTPIGHRGHGGAFLTGNSQLFSISKPDDGVVKGCQCPIYTHEVHMLKDTMVQNLLALESTVEEIVSDMLDKVFKVVDGLWSVHMVDLYVCPRTGDFCHTVQIAYGSTSIAISRSMADSFRELVERDLCDKMHMSARQEKHGGRVSRPYPWYVAQALKRARSKEEEEVLRGDRTSSSGGGIGGSACQSSSDAVIRKRVGLERDLDGDESGRSNHLEDSYYDSEMLRGLARQLWTYRASVLSLWNVKD